LPSSGIGNLRVHVTSRTLAAAISAAPSGLFLTAAKTASLICVGVALFQFTPSGKKKEGSNDLFADLASAV
jgi:hypothetical protein